MTAETDADGTRVTAAEPPPSVQSSPDHIVMDGITRLVARQTHQFVRASDAMRHGAAKRAGVTYSELRALVRISDAVQITPKALSLALDLTTGAITAISTSLFERALLSRVEHPRDRRSLHLQLTPAGAAIVAAVYNEFDSVIRASLEGMNEQQQETCRQFLMKATGGFTCGSGEPSFTATDDGRNDHCPQ